MTMISSNLILLLGWWEYYTEDSKRIIKDETVMTKRIGKSTLSNNNVTKVSGILFFHPHMFYGEGGNQRLKIRV